MTSSVLKILPRLAFAKLCFGSVYGAPGIGVPLLTSLDPGVCVCVCLVGVFVITKHDYGGIMKLEISFFIYTLYLFVLCSAT